MNVLHVSPIYNRNSIIKNGITPTPVKNINHLEAFKKDRVVSNDTAIYTWQDSIYNEKYIRDLIYAITWIHPRNDIGCYYNDNFNDEIDWRNVERKPIYKYNQMIFDVYIAQVSTKIPDYNHLQEPGNDIYSTTYNMHERFAHNDKPLCIYDKPLKVIKIIGQANYYYDNINHNFTIKNL